MTTRLAADVKEITFCLLLDELYGEDVTQGDTTRAVRMERARKLILDQHAAERLVGRAQTMAQAFESAYGEPLDPATETTTEAAA